MKTLTTLAIIAGLAAGCHRTTYVLRPGAGPVRPAAQHFQLSLINIFELSSPIDLAAECGVDGAVAIDERVGVLGGIVNIVLSNLLPILHVHNATVGCGGGGGGPPAM